MAIEKITKSTFFLEYRQEPDSYITLIMQPCFATEAAAQDGAVYACMCKVWAWQIVEVRPDGTREVVYSTIGEEL